MGVFGDTSTKEGRLESSRVAILYYEKRLAIFKKDSSQYNYYEGLIKELKEYIGENNE